MGSMFKSVVFVAALALVGCSDSMLKPYNQQVDADQREASQVIESTRGGYDGVVGQVRGQGNVNRMDMPWLPVTKVAPAQDAQAKVALARQVAVNRQFRDVNDAASYVTSLTGVLTSVRLYKKEDGAAAQPVGGAAAASQNDSLSGDKIFGRAAPVVYSGDLSGLLDLISARYNMFWEWERGTVSFFRTKSETFRLAALPGDTSMKNELGTSSGGSGGGSSGGESGGTSNESEMTTGVSFDALSVWGGIETSVRSMLSPDGTVVVTPSTGTLTVEDTPIILERVRQFIDSQNAALARQVMINVRVLAVDLSGSDQYGIDWAAAYEAAGSSFGASLANTLAPPDDATSLTLQVLSGSPWADTEAIISALSKQGRVSQVTSASVVTINNQPTPIQVARKTAYLKESEISTDEDGDPTVSLTPGEITTGFSMNVLPHILDGKRLMLQYSAEISKLLGIEDLPVEGTLIQIPEIDTRSFLQRVIMNSGETLVVSGFEQMNTSSNTHGVGDARNVALGGGLDGQKDKSVIVVLIQPVLTRNR
jgi:type IVB pilus formation R64 PilN family outer membrane protein